MTKNIPLETAFNQFEKRTQQLSECYAERINTFDEDTADLIKRVDLKFEEMENRIDKIYARYLYLTISILGVLIVAGISFISYLWW